MNQQRYLWKRINRYKLQEKCSNNEGYGNEWLFLNATDKKQRKIIKG